MDKVIIPVLTVALVDRSPDGSGAEEKSDEENHIFPNASAKMFLFSENKQSSPWMSFLDKVHRLQRIDRLIQMKATGTPEQLPTTLDISERSV